MPAKKKTKKKLPEPVPVEVHYKEFLAIAPEGDEPSRANSTIIAVPDNYAAFDLLPLMNCTLREAKKAMTAYWDEWERLEAEAKVAEDLAEAGRVKEAIDKADSKNLQVDYCTRDAYHDGPCNGYPNLTCDTRFNVALLPKENVTTGSSATLDLINWDNIVLKDMPLVYEQPSAWERFKKFMGV